MLELAAGIVVSAVALTFVSDMMSRAVKLARPSRARGGNIRVADVRHSAG